MVIVKLMCGLGNQMFQYAAGRRLAHLHGVPLKLETSAYQRLKRRAYALGHFKIQEDFATPRDVARVAGASGPRIVRLARRLWRALKPYHQRPVIVERRQLAFDPNIAQAPRDVYLIGFWQNPRYFADIEDIIRAEFVVKSEMHGRNRETADGIRSTVSVGVHVRRGDYVSVPRIHARHGTCGVDYYQAGARLVAERVGDPHFFVFSDEPEWARANLRFDHPATIVSHNGPDRDYEDLRLLSMCRHFIIANSTFSWWGAWLSQNPGKLVVAPKRWYATDHVDDSGLIPPGWHRL